MNRRLNRLIAGLTAEEQAEVERFIAALARRRRGPACARARGWESTIGAWRDERTTEEIIRDIYEARTAGREVTI